MDQWRSFLERLRQAGEKALTKGGSRVRPVDCRSTESAYWALPLEQRDELHAYLRRAEAVGAVELEWSRHGGDDRVLERIRLKDVGKLTDYLGVTSYSSLLEAARAAFSPWLAVVPSLGNVLRAWERHKTVRRHDPREASDFVDAARVIAFMHRTPTDEEPVRYISRKLFRDSKRVESLVSLIDVLTADSISSPAMHWEHVLSGIGLRKEPLAFFFAGRGSVVLRDDGERELSREYVGFPAAQIVGFRGTPAWVLSIENRESFHLAARALAAAPSGLLLYTGGMPSPAWRRAYRAVVTALPARTALYHWGDIDDGGFRIAECISNAIAPMALQPWCMDPAQLEGTLPCPTSLQRRMARTAERLGWREVAKSLREHPPSTLEQEELAVKLPT